MPKLYEDDYRNTARDDIAGTLAARKSPVGYGLEQAGRAMATSPFSAASKTADGSVPMLGGSASSVLPTTSMQQDMAPAMPMLEGLGMQGLPQMPGMQMPGMGQRRRMY